MTDHAEQEQRSASRRGRVLAVDDRHENLVALAAALDPLELDVVFAHSGEDALRVLLRETDIAVVLLDVQMPDIDGFETAELIKSRDKTRHLPIIFLTAHEIDSVRDGYEAGAIDYLKKPLDPVLLRSKVQVLIDLHDAHQRLATQARQLERIQQREERRKAEAAARISEARYAALAEAIPQIVWTAHPHGGTDYLNDRWFEYTGQTPATAREQGWTAALHPDDHAPMRETWKRSLETGEPFDIEYRLRRFDGAYRWYLGRALATRDGDGHITGWVGTCTDIDDRKRIEIIQHFLGESTALLASREPDEALDEVCHLAGELMVDWCDLYLVGETMPAAARQVVERGESMRVADLDRTLARAWTLDEARADDWAVSGSVAAIAVPLATRGVVLGAIVLASDQPRMLGRDDMFWAEELASRVAATIDAAFLLRQAEDRAQAAEVLDAVGDGVMLVGADGEIRLWNPAAATITGRSRDEVIGRALSDVLDGWSHHDDARSQTVAVDVDGRELWLSVTGVETAIGTVYAFRDLTADRAVEKMKSDFIATISHELRTPLAAIYGAAGTIQRPDLELDDETRGQLLDLISDQSERLAQIVNDVLLASRLDSVQADAGDVGPVNVAAVAARVLEAAEVHRPDNVQLELVGADEPVTAIANGEHVQQVLNNFVDNAMKYSPDGGPVTVNISSSDHRVHVTVRDHGIGIPPAEQGRIFEKFYRLDADMTRGIGGTGLGLYICRELARHMNGRIWHSAPRSGPGSIFHLELQAAR